MDQNTEVIEGMTGLIVSYCLVDELHRNGDNTEFKIKAELHKKTTTTGNTQVHETSQLTNRQQ